MLAFSDSLPDKGQYFAAYLQLPGFLVGNDALVGGNDSDAKSSQHLGELILACVHPQTRLGDPLDPGNDLLVLVFSVF